MRPCRAFCFLLSSLRFRTRRPSCSSAVMPSTRGWVSVPLGPATVTTPASTFTWTPLASGMGSLPIRDMALSALLPLPHVTEDLAADARPLAGRPGEDPLGGGEDRDAQASQDPGDLALATVDPAPGAAHALQAGDRLLSRVPVFQLQPQLALAAVLHQLVAGEVPLLGQDARDLRLHLGSGHVHRLVAGHETVAQPRQQVGDRIGHAHRARLLTSSTSSPRGGLPPGPGS